MDTVAQVRRHGIGIARSLVFVACLAAIVVLPGSISAKVTSVTITLEEVDVPGISGTATLTAAGEATAVEMTLAGPSVTGDHPTHIHTGTCDNFNPNPLYPLTTVSLDPVDEQGESSTVVDDVSLDELLAGDFVILVHQSADELTTYLVCGEIKEPAQMPATGAGTATQTGARPWLLAFGAAALLAAVAWRLRSGVSGAGL